MADEQKRMGIGEFDDSFYDREKLLSGGVDHPGIQSVLALTRPNNHVPDDSSLVEKYGREVMSASLASIIKNLNDDE